MALSEDERSRLLVSTRGAAGAFVEDMEYLCEAVERKETSRGEIRRISAILRRLVVDRDLGIVAGPRLGKITITAPDNRAFYRVAEKLEYLIFVSGGAKVFEAWIDRINVLITDRPANASEADVAKKLLAKLPTDDRATWKVQLTLDQFAQQKVLFYRGCWVTRQQVIKYMANISSGVHSGAPTEKFDLALAQLRHSTGVTITGPTSVNLDVFKGGLHSQETAVTHSRDSVDLVLVETLAAATWLTDSPRVLQLENAVREELGLPEAAPRSPKE
ncbi:hypothetical protein [Mesorhizobium sp. M0618]|uniref:hypothetical protein n=1 Tax=unclassified Mesorhizobium TaxID=325217 RepID=UPI003336A182